MYFTAIVEFSKVWETEDLFFLFCFDTGQSDNDSGNDTKISMLVNQNTICSHLACMQHPLRGADIKNNWQLRGLKWLSH